MTKRARLLLLVCVALALLIAVIWVAVPTRPQVDGAVFEQARRSSERAVQEQKTRERPEIEGGSAVKGFERQGK
jgi:hypothetical protein